MLQINRHIENICIYIYIYIKRERETERYLIIITLLFIDDSTQVNDAIQLNRRVSARSEQRAIYTSALL